MSHGKVELLPFTFRRMPRGDVLLVSQAGEFLFVSAPNFTALVQGESELPSSLYLDLESKHLAYRGTSDLAVDLLATKLRTRKAFLRDFTSLHMVVVTAHCNSACRYCQASSMAPEAGHRHMSFETARAVVRMIFESPSPHIKIEFQGGEPLLNWSVVTEIVRQAERVNRNACKDLEFVLCTNLALLDRDKLLFLREHHIGISTSLDGPKDLHDTHRIRRDGSSGYDAFRRGLDLVQQDSEVGCSALLTVTRSHLGRLCEVVDEYVRLGFRGIFLRALNPYGSAREHWGELSYSAEDFTTAYKEALSYIIELNRRGTFFVEYYASLLLTRILTPFSTGFVDLQSPSGAGISGVIYDFDGDVYPADEARMLARMRDKIFRLGNVHQDSYQSIFAGEKLRKLTAASCVETLPGCAWCAYQLYCGGDPIRSYAESGEMVGHRPTSAFCRRNLAIFDHLFDLLRESDPGVMDVFWSWITQRGLHEVCL